MDRAEDRSGTPVAWRREGPVAVLTLDSPRVNALSRAMREAIRARFEEARADPEIRAIVLAGAGRLFCGGADITEFDTPSEGIELPRLIDIVESSDKPVVAAIHGQALGGGLELALGCHRRVVARSAKLGLPEVKLGIVPGAGGTQRLPRLVGVERALEMITSGSPIGAEEALKVGLVDCVSEEASLLAQALALALDAAKAGQPPARTRDRDDRLAEARQRPELFDAFRKAQAKRFRGVEAPEACLACVEAACRLPFAEGLAFERETFKRLRDGAQSIALRHVFFAEREACKVPGLAPDAATRPVRSVGIVGAGTMGGGIAMNFLNAGIPVTIVEANPEALKRGLEIIRRNYEATARKGRMRQEEIETRMGLLSDSLDLETLAECDLVIEAVFEEMAIKRTVFTQLDRIVKPGAILASNTSFLDLDDIAATTGRPRDVIGLHFFSPANVMRLLEVVRGAKTAPDVVATAMKLARTIGKVAVQVGVCHGFVGNRLLDQRQREADRLVLDGAKPWDVDRVLQGFGLPMGPFAMMDLVGLDLGWSAETSRGISVRDILCERDRRGQKTGKGFYDYDSNRRARPSDEVEAVIRGVAERERIAQRAVADQEILERCLYPMVNEGAKILEEGKAHRAGDIDTVWINGFAWPAWTGGPMHWADGVGLAAILARLRAYEERYGADFAPSALLERLVADESGFGALDRAQRASRA